MQWWSLRVRHGAIALWCSLVCMMVQVSSALAEPTTTKPEQVSTAPAPDAARPIDPGIGPTALALGAGFVVHGAGSYVAGDRLSARRLLISEGVALAAFLGAGSLLAATGASRKLVAVGLPVVASGVSVFMLGWAADLYAASTGGRDVTGTPQLSAFEAELGPRYVYDPQFAYRNFIYAQVDLRVDRLRASPMAWIAADDDNQRLSFDSAYRVWGRSMQRATRDGSHLDLALAMTYHRYPNERFAVYTPEWRVEGRLDLSHVGRSLRGAFVDGQLGYGLELYDFEAAPGGPDPFGLLLARFGFGIYFGDSALHSGEASVYYDQRHDDFAAGLGVRGIGGGFLGHVGLKAHQFFAPAWGVGLLIEGGSAIVAGLSMKYRYLPQGGAR
jgi:hypothetical protein